MVYVTSEAFLAEALPSRSGCAAADAVPALSGRGRLPRAGKRSPLILSLRSLRGEYGCVCATHARRTDEPWLVSTPRITREELAARNRYA